MTILSLIGTLSIVLVAFVYLALRPPAALPITRDPVISAPSQVPTDGLTVISEAPMMPQQDAVEHACRKARLRGGISKPISPHSLRHAFAVPAA